MKTLIQKVLFIMMIGSICSPSRMNAQCNSGYYSSAINWDFQYFKDSTGFIPPSGTNFMIGVNSMRLSWTGTNTLNTNTGAHTGESGSFGAGNDLKFTVGNGADTLVFTNEVQNLKFSVYDIDNSQKMVVTAKNAAGTAQNITLARVSGTTLTIAGSGTTSASATANSTAVANSATNATANVTVSASVKTVILTFTKSSGTDSLYLSDISACVNGDFPDGYQAAYSTPELGQHVYMLASYGNTIYIVDKTNNTAAALFSDPVLAQLNSLAYDPANQVVYYTDQNPVSTNKSLYKYDIRSNTKYTVLADVTTMGMQLFSNGLGSAAASFYNGSLFLGVDQDGVGYSPVAVWRIDFNSSGAAILASRFWGANSKAGAGGILYDWADFVINNGVLYNFNAGGSAAANTNVLHLDLNTQAVLNGYTVSGLSQASIDYAGNIYNMVTGSYSLYNGAGGFGSATNYTGYTSTILDAAEAFKYPYDYGDAPASYGNAYHLYNYSSSNKLRIGSKLDFEPRDSSNASATADDNYDTGGSGNDEDGITAFNPISTSWYSYTVNVAVTNTTGANAYMYGYIDFNRDGDFDDPGERSGLVTIPNGATSANVLWAGLTGGSIGASFIRFRLASSASEVSSPYGYAGSGEDEDYPFNIDATNLPVELVDFTGKAQENNTTLLNWTTASELNNDHFIIQRSKEGTQWENIGNIRGNGNSNRHIPYSFIDEHPYPAINYYRLEQVDYDGHIDYSPIVSVEFNSSPKTAEIEPNIIVYPNPARNIVWIRSNQGLNEETALDLEIYNIRGERVFTDKLKNDLQQVDLSEYQSGYYCIKIGNKIYKVLKE